MSNHPSRRVSLKGIIVAIDGPSGAGKSTVASLLAEELDGILLNTGAMYRAVAYYALLREKKTAKDLGELARELTFDVGKNDQLLVDKEDLGSKLRTEGVSKMASDISKYQSVRRVLTQRQREFGRRLSAKRPVVMEGRDIGTYVFPKAPFKFFVTADSKVRAKRRLDQLKRQGMKGLSLKEVEHLNEDRDRQDSSRKHAPLKCADDAIVVDTSSMKIEQVVQFMADHVIGRSTLKSK